MCFAHDTVCGLASAVKSHTSIVQIGNWSWPPWNIPTNGRTSQRYAHEHKVISLQAQSNIILAQQTTIILATTKLNMDGFVVIHSAKHKALWYIAFVSGQWLEINDAWNKRIFQLLSCSGDPIATAAAAALAVSTNHQSQRMAKIKIE